MNKYLDYTEYDSDDDLSMREQLTLVAQNQKGDNSGFLLWRRQGGVTGTWVLAHFENEEDAQNAKSVIESITEEHDMTGSYHVQEL